MVRRLILSLMAFGIIVVIGICGFMVLEGMSFTDAVYLTIVTVTTVGYGDIIPVTNLGKLFAVFLIITGVGMAYYTFMLFVSMAIEGQLANVLGRKSMQRRIAALDNHIIVCGAGKVGSHVIERLQQEKEIFVVIEKEQTVCDSLAEQKILVLNGDATLDEVLLEGGLVKAKGVISTLSHDADNVYVTLTAKNLNPQIKVVSRAERAEAEEKLRRAGADTIIFPSVMGGRQMVTAMTKPIIMDLFENVFDNEEVHLNLAQITVYSSSSLIGHKLSGSGIKERYQAFVVAIRRKNQFITNPNAEETIMAEDTLIVMGQRILLEQLNQIAVGGA